MLAVALAGAAASPPAWADPTDQDNALALQLFDEGRALLTAGQIAEAYHKLEESWRLNPLPGTLLNLAVCSEQQGRMASAVTQFRQARALAGRDHRYDRLAFADQHLRAIEGKVSSLVIVVGPGADLPDLRVARDGTAVGRIVWGSRIPMDPGEHVVEASAPSKKPWSVTVTVLPDGDVQTVTLEALEDAAPPPLPVQPLPPVVQPPPSQPAAAAPPQQGHAMSTRKIIALASVASGVVGVGIGSYFGLVAISRYGDATCRTDSCSQQSISLARESATVADFSTGAFAAGLVALGVGAVLWLGDSRREDRTRALSVMPSIGPRSGGVNLAGRF